MLAHCGGTAAKREARVRAVRVFTARGRRGINVALPQARARQIKRKCVCTRARRRGAWRIALSARKQAYGVAASGAKYQRQRRRRRGASGVTMLA